MVLLDFLGVGFAHLGFLSGSEKSQNFIVDVFAQGCCHHI